MDLSRLGDVLPDVRRIAVLRANAIGDFVVTLPALEALRTTYPEADVVLLGTPMHAELLAGRPGPVDRVEIVPQLVGIRDGQEDPRQIQDFIHRMQAQRFDVAVQVHGGGRHSNRLIRRLGAVVTVGLRTPDAEPLDRWLPYVYYQHEVLRFLEVVGLIGAAPRTVTPRLAVTGQDRARARAALAGRPDARPVAVLHPGATDARRRWPADRFATVGDALAAAGATVVVTGSADERTLATEVAARMGHDAAVLAGQLTLSALTGVLEQAAVVVSNDTGPRHLAEAVGTATVAVYWCGNMINAGPLARTRHRPHISWRLDCPECRASAMTDVYPARAAGQSCSHRSSWVTEVPVAEVLPDALELLATESA